MADLSPPIRQTPLLPAASRRQFLVGGALLGTALLAEVARPKPSESRFRDPEALAGVIPDRIGPWTSSPFDNVLIPKGEQRDERVYDDVVTRYFTSDAAGAVMLLIAYGSAQEGEAQLHRPEVCYPSAGFRLRDWPDVPLAFPDVRFDARAMTATAAGRVEQLLYWTRIGNDFPTSSLGQRWSILRHSLRGEVPDGALVRISTIDPERKRAMRLLEGFAAALVGSGNAELRSLLVGRS